MVQAGSSPALANNARTGHPRSGTGREKPGGRATALLSTGDTVTDMDQFEASVRRFFDPIADAAGMGCTVEEGIRVRFENESVFLEVLFDTRRWREISVVIGQREHTPEMFPVNLVDVLRAYGYPDLSQVEALRGSTDEAVDQAIEILAGLTQKYALKLFGNDRGEFLYVAAYRKWASLKYAWETNKPKSMIAAYPGLIASSCYERVRSTFNAQDLEILAIAKQLTEECGPGF